MLQLLTALLSLFNTLLQDIRALQKRIDQQEQEMATVTELVQELEADVVSVRNTIEALRQAQADLKAIVDELSQRVISEEDKARLAQIDADLDAAIAPVEPPVA